MARFANCLEFNLLRDFFFVLMRLIAERFQDTLGVWLRASVSCCFSRLKTDAFPDINL